MRTPESFSLEQLTNYKEDSLLEVKSARGGLPNSLWESYSAFANSQGGAPKLEVTTSGGVDRTTLTLDFEGHQPDITAMRRLYGNSNDLIEPITSQDNNGGEENVPQNNRDVPQNNGDVPQNNGDVPQNSDEDIKTAIVKHVCGNSQITRELIAKELGVSAKTVGRYLSKLGISWEGHPKTGHWILPQDNE